MISVLASTVNTIVFALLNHCSISPESITELRELGSRAAAATNLRNQRVEITEVEGNDLLDLIDKHESIFAEQKINLTAERRDLVSGLMAKAKATR